MSNAAYNHQAKTIIILSNRGRIKVRRERGKNVIEPKPNKAKGPIEFLSSALILS